MYLFNIPCSKCTFVIYIIFQFCFSGFRSTVQGDLEAILLETMMTAWSRSEFRAVFGNNAQFPWRQPDRRRLRWSAALSVRLMSPFPSIERPKRSCYLATHGHFGRSPVCLSQLRISASTGCKLSDGASSLFLLCKH